MSTNFFYCFNSLSTHSSTGLLGDFQDADDPTGSQGNTNELISYCLGTNENEGVDFMDWWRRNATAYPTLAMMARDIFAVPVSTVPSESCFSSANRILTDKRSKLGAHVFERLVCLKDWIDAENRTQHAMGLEASSSGVDTQESGTEGPEPNEDSDGEQESDLWYMHNNY